jgi:hypothetical protein
LVNGFLKIKFYSQYFLHIVLHTVVMQRQVDCLRQNFELIREDSPSIMILRSERRGEAWVYWRNNYFSDDDR